MDVKQLLSLDQKVILVTGGAGKFGRAIVEGLAEADGTVISASRNLAACEASIGALRGQDKKVHAMQFDQGDPESVTTLIHAIVEEFGRLDALVNNAFTLPMLKFDDALEKWNESMAVNAAGLFNITREAIAQMATKGGGSIVNIASMKATHSPDFDLYAGTQMDSPPDYNFHKGGMISLTKYVARKFGPRNIRANCISPGGLLADQPETFRRRYNKRVPLGRMAEHDDIKGLVVLLVSDASAYITGEDILMDGGMHC